MAGYVLLLVATSTSGLLTEGEFSRSDPCVRDLDSAACRAVPMIMTKSMKPQISLTATRMNVSMQKRN